MREEVLPLVTYLTATVTAGRRFDATGKVQPSPWKDPHPRDLALDTGQRAPTPSHSTVARSPAGGCTRQREGLWRRHHHLSGRHGRLSLDLPWCGAREEGER
jgi:hypothetical protein